MDATPTSATAAAIWSAVAASFAALASLLIMLIQRRSLLESVRPELVLTGWGRAARGEGNGTHEVITFETIKNVGRGAALHISFGSMQELDGKPTAILSSTRLPILAPKTKAVMLTARSSCGGRTCAPTRRATGAYPSRFVFLAWTLAGCVIRPLTPSGP